VHRPEHAGTRPALAGLQHWHYAHSHHYRRYFQDRPLASAVTPAKLFADAGQIQAERVFWSGLSALASLATSPANVDMAACCEHVGRVALATLACNAHRVPHHRAYLSWLAREVSGYHVLLVYFSTLPTAAIPVVEPVVGLHTPPPACLRQETLFALGLVLGTNFMHSPAAWRRVCDLVNLYDHQYVRTPPNASP